MQGRQQAGGVGYARQACSQSPLWRHEEIQAGELLVSSPATAAGCGDAGRHEIAESRLKVSCMKEDTAAESSAPLLAGPCRTARPAGGLLTGITCLLQNVCTSFSTSMTQGKVHSCGGSRQPISFILQISHKLSQGLRLVASFASHCMCACLA